MGYKTEHIENGNIGQTLESLASTIAGRWNHPQDESYTSRLLNGSLENLQKKVGEEAIETILACNSADKEHVRYEAADLMYHLMVLLEREGITLGELAGELNARMSLK